MRLQQNVFSLHSFLLNKVPRKILIILTLLFTLYIALSISLYLSAATPKIQMYNALKQYYLHNIEQYDKYWEGMHNDNQTNSNEEQDDKNSTDLDKLKRSPERYKLLRKNQILVVYSNDKLSSVKWQVRKQNHNQLPAVILSGGEYIYGISKDLNLLQKHQIEIVQFFVPQVKPIRSLFYRSEGKENIAQAEIYFQNVVQNLIKLQIESSVELRPLSIFDKTIYQEQFMYIVVDPFRYKIGAENAVRRLGLNHNIIVKLFMLLIGLIQLYLTNIAVGIFIRMLIVAGITFFALFWNTEKLGQLATYRRILSNRFRNSPWKRYKLLIFIILSMLLCYSFFTLAGRITSLASLNEASGFVFSFYCPEIVFNIFCGELLYYLFARSRISLKFYPIMFLLNYILLLQFMFFNNTFLQVQYIQIHLYLSLLFGLLILTIQSLIADPQINLYGYKMIPSLSKPRMLFFPGYDICWENAIPPLWTYFSTMFDYSCFNTKSRSYIDGDYQLLYGLLLGINGPEELPENQSDEELPEKQSEKEDYLEPMSIESSREENLLH